MVSRASRSLRRGLKPVEWVVLEELALAARRDEAGRLVAATSGRQIAEDLALSPGAAASALGRLRALGLVTYARQAGPAGRFGLSVYLLESVAGLEVLADAGCLSDSPDVASPRAAPPCAADAHMVKAPADVADAEASGGAKPGPAPPRRQDRSPAVAAAAGQERTEPGTSDAGSSQSPAEHGGPCEPQPQPIQLSILGDDDRARSRPRPTRRPSSRPSR